MRKIIITALFGLSASASVAFAQVAIVDSNASGMGQASISTGYIQNFDSLPAGGQETSAKVDKLEWAHNETLPGWYYSMALGREAISSNGQFVQAPRFFNYGLTGSSDRAAGLRGNANAKSDAAFGVVFINNSKKIISGLTVAYTGEQWRWMGPAKSNLEFGYKALGASFNSGTFNPRVLKDWTRVDALDFAAIKAVAGSASRLDGNAAANRRVIEPVTIKFSKPVAPGAAFALRWYYPGNTLTGQGLAVDDLKVTFITE